MNTRLCLLVLFISQFTVVHAQNAIQSPGTIYKTWITLHGEKGKMKGVLYGTRDSSILISDSHVKANYMDGKYTLRKVDVADIDKITVRRLNGIGRGVLIGGLSGAAIGATIGLTAENTAADKRANTGFKITGAIANSLFMGLCGATIGAAIGLICTSFHLSGSQTKYNTIRKNLAKRSLSSGTSTLVDVMPVFKRLRDSVVDVDGNKYHTVALGAMVFMAENLKTKHFRNGKAIPLINDTAGWRKMTGAARCNYLNDSIISGQYGQLYNAYAISDTAGICPTGWHIPTFNEWTSLVMCLGGNENAGGIMKESGTMHWSSPNKTLLTENTFSLPSGYRSGKGVYAPSGRTCQWWAPAENNADPCRGISLNNETTAVTSTTPGKNSGLSVRCMQDN
jgi:uncharacterized protein (TIGR02145 family)